VNHSPGGDGDVEYRFCCLTQGDFPTLMVVQDAGSRHADLLATLGLGYGRTAVISSRKAVPRRDLESRESEAGISLANYRGRVRSSTSV
jgi:sulfur carrier protein ThiS